jgi:hypothetical protein
MGWRIFLGEKNHVHWRRALECGTKDNRGREVPLEGIGVFGMGHCRNSSCLGGKACTFAY